MRDFRYAIRGLRNQPLFASLAILTLALGIGASTAIFSVLYAILFDPFPYIDPAHIVSIAIYDTSGPEENGRYGFSLDEFLYLKEHNHVFTDMIASGGGPVVYRTGQGSEQFKGAYMTANNFRFLGVPAYAGRLISEDDAKPGAPLVFAMSYALWKSRFNSDLTLLGKEFNLNGKAMTLVCVMPSRFTKRGAEIWTPASLDRTAPENRQRYFVPQGRLKPGLTVGDAKADLNVVAHNMARSKPDRYPKNFNVHVQTYIDDLLGHFRTTLYTLAAAVFLLLLIACTNVTNMLLSRATAREKEMAVRSALGATRFQLVRQLLIESLVLALAGAASGWALAWAGVKALVAVIPRSIIPQEAVIGLNGHVLLFSLATAVLTSLIFGLAPALQTVNRNIAEPLKDSGKGVSGGFRHGKLRNGLVVFEVALSLVLLAGAGLLARTFVGLQTADLGFKTDHLILNNFFLPAKKYETAEQKAQLFGPLLQRLRALPGVAAASETSSFPPFGADDSPIEIPGRTSVEKSVSNFDLCSDDYFAALGITVLRGRAFTGAEVSSARKVAVVNQIFARRYFGTEEPIGRQVRIAKIENGLTFEIIGIAPDFRNNGLHDPIVPEMFIPYTVSGMDRRGVIVRTVQDPVNLLQAMRREVWAADRSIALSELDTLENLLSQYEYSEPRFSMLVLVVFATVGTVLVSLGVYSVLAYTVSRQTHEIGIRMALGASVRDVMKMVLRLGAKLIGLGAAFGLAASFALTRVLKSQLYGLSAMDPLSLIGAILLVALTGLAACYFPARRATRVEPVIALHYE